MNERDIQGLNVYSFNIFNITTGFQVLSAEFEVLSTELQIHLNKSNTRIEVLSQHRHCNVKEKKLQLVQHFLITVNKGNILTLRQLFVNHIFSMICLYGMFESLLLEL